MAFNGTCRRNFTGRINLYLNQYLAVRPRRKGNGWIIGWSDCFDNGWLFVGSRLMFRGFY